MPLARCLYRTDILTPEEREAAQIGSYAKKPFLPIDDEMFARIESSWARLPQRPGLGPWIVRGVDFVQASAPATGHAEVYRISPDAWGLMLLLDTPDAGVYRGTLDEMLERAVAAWPPAPPVVYPLPKPTAELPEYIEAAAIAPFAAIWGRFRVVHESGDDDHDRYDEGWNRHAERTPAQTRAAGILRERATEIRDALLHALYADYLGHDESMGRERVGGPREVPEHASLDEIRLLRRERDGIAYARLEFGDGWRVEHGLMAILHGARVVEVGDHDLARGFDDEGDGEAAPIRGADGAIVAARWVEAPGDDTVAFPFWEGLPGRFKVKFAVDEDEEVGRTDAQNAAAAHLVEHGDAVRAALLSTLYRSYQKKTPEPRPLATTDALGAILEARSIRIDFEEQDDLAYVALTVGAPWRDSGRATVVMHGSRVVVITTPAKVEDAILDDQDAVLRARRAKKAAAEEAAASKRAARKKPAAKARAGKKQVAKPAINKGAKKAR